MSLHKPVKRMNVLSTFKRSDGKTVVLLPGGQHGVWAGHGEPRIGEAVILVEGEVVRVRR